MFKNNSELLAMRLYLYHMKFGNKNILPEDFTRKLTLWETNFLSTVAAEETRSIKIPCVRITSAENWSGKSMSQLQREIYWNLLFQRSQNVFQIALWYFTIINDKFPFNSIRLKSNTLHHPFLYYYIVLTKPYFYTLCLEPKVNGAVVVPTSHFPD